MITRMTLVLPLLLLSQVAPAASPAALSNLKCQFGHFGKINFGFSVTHSMNKVHVEIKDIFKSGPLTELARSTGGANPGQAPTNGLAVDFASSECLHTARGLACAAEKAPIELLYLDEQPDVRKITGVTSQKIRIEFSNGLDLVGDAAYLPLIELGGFEIEGTPVAKAFCD